VAIGVAWMLVLTACATGTTTTASGDPAGTAAAATCPPPNIVKVTAVGTSTQDASGTKVRVTITVTCGPPVTPGTTTGTTTITDTPVAGARAQVGWWWLDTVDTFGPSKADGVIIANKTSIQSGDPTKGKEVKVTVIIADGPGTPTTPLKIPVTVTMP
jgi:hypothetical protein